jgi:hypothetical protein
LGITRTTGEPENLFGGVGFGPGRGVGDLSDQTLDIERLHRDDDVRRGVDRITHRRDQHRILLG